MEEPTSQAPPPPSPPPSDRAEHLLAAALDHAAEEREAFLITACEGDAVLLADVRALLAAYEAMPTGFLGAAVAATAGGSPTSHLDPTIQMVPGPRSRPHEMPMQEQAGERIGRYKLLQEIGAGGFGTVWMAEQLEPVTRRVALKIIKLGMDTKEVIARFEAERQALAMMEHPNIAKVLDGGATDKGRPFFVMELVKGLPITQYCDEAGLSTRERLELFSDVCAAIQHAHQKGIIHRDIKPSNVMVTLYADKPVVKVIDFGIAKATQGKLTDKTLFTRIEQFVGTPVYMSPEQASLSSVDIDTRSDIYSLGILLYEMLVGKPPFDSRSLLSAGYEEMRRIIREVEPAKPSSRLSTVAGEERTLLAKAHRIQPEKLDRLVEPDLDWIVMKAIDKDRARRYETANAFAEDIRRFLCDEPVSATPPSRGYQFRKFARRHKAALNIAGAIATVLVLATVVSTWQAMRAMRAERKTAETLVQVAAERDAKELARQEAEDIATFLSKVFQSPDPARDGRTITVAETLDRAVKTLETDLASQPAQRARLQSTLSATYMSLGLVRQAIPLREKVRDYLLATKGPEHPQTLTAVLNLAITYLDAGRLEEAFQMQEQTMALSRKLYGPEHAVTVLALHGLAVSHHKSTRRAEAIRVQGELLPLYRKLYGPEHPDTLRAMHNMAAYYDADGRKDEAIKLMEEVLALRRKVSGPEHPDTLAAMVNLATGYEDSSRRGEAPKLHEEVLALGRKVYGPEHPDTLRMMSNVAMSYALAGRGEEVLKMREEVLALSRKLSGPEHPDTLAAMQDVAISYDVVGRHAEALKLREEALPLSRKVLGPKHGDTLAETVNLASSYQLAGRTVEAIKLLEDTWAIHREVNSMSAIHACVLMKNLASYYRVTGRKEEAVKTREALLTFTRKTSGPEHADTLEAMRGLATDYGKAGNQEEGLKLREELLAITRKVSGPEHADTLAMMRELAYMYGAAGRSAKMFEMQEEVLAILQRVQGPDHPDTLGMMNGMAWTLSTCPDATLRNPKRAVELASHAAKTNPTIANYTGTLGVSQYRAGEYTAAIASLQKSIGMREKGDAANGFTLAMSRWQLGEKDQARKDYDLAVTWMAYDQGRKDEFLRFQKEAAGVLGVEVE